MRLSPVFLVLALFWATMNVLLWRSELGEVRSGGSPVSPEVVLERLLTAPDPSTLEVRYQGKKAGYIHWYPDPGEEAQSRKMLNADYVPEGMVRTLRGYEVRLEGHLQAEALDARFRFQVELQLDTNRVWQTLRLQAGSRPGQLQLVANAVDRTLEWKLVQGESTLGTKLSFDELRDPRKLLGEMGTPLALALAGPLAQSPASLDLTRAIHWDARLGWVPLGSSQIRVYRLRARLLDRHEVVLHINRAGEILRVELPGGVSLVNEGLGSI